MLLELLVCIFTSILRSRWNSIVLGEQEYEGDIASYLIVTILPPRALPNSLTWADLITPVSQGLP